MTKTEFILSQPLDMPAKQVAALARKAGLKFAPTYVHVTRHKARKGGAVAKTTAIKPTKSARSDLAIEFRRLAFRLGYDAALAEVEAMREVSL